MARPHPRGRKTEGESSTKGALSLPPPHFISSPLRTAVLALLGLMAGMAGARAWAFDDGGDTPRLLSFGGICLNCELSGRQLPSARFMGADFEGTSLVHADLHGAAFFGSNFANADLSRANLRGASLFGSTFLGANFTGADLAGAQGNGVNLLNANLTRANLEGAVLPGSVLLRVEAREAKFGHAQLMGANLSEGHFERASFAGANLAAATLTGASFAGADFGGASLIRAALAGADLSSAKRLTQPQIDQACGGPGLRLPPGLVGKTCKGGSHLIILRQGNPAKYVVQVDGR